MMIMYDNQIVGIMRDLAQAKITSVTFHSDEKLKISPLTSGAYEVDIKKIDVTNINVSISEASTFYNHHLRENSIPEIIKYEFKSNFGSFPLESPFEVLRNIGLSKSTYIWKVLEVKNIDDYNFLMLLPKFQFVHNKDYFQDDYDIDMENNLNGYYS